MSTVDQLGSESLRSYERIGLWGLLFLVVSFGVLVEIRSAYMGVRRTDVGCYLRAAWAVRANHNIYQVTDDNWWHYAYPPVIAILLTPLADAPAGFDRHLMLPYPLTVAIWYILSVLAIFLAVDWIASTLESSSSNPAIRSIQPGSRRW